MVIVRLAVDDPGEALVKGKRSSDLVSVYKRYGTPTTDRVFPWVGQTSAQMAMHHDAIRRAYPERAARSPYAQALAEGRGVCATHAGDVVVGVPIDPCKECGLDLPGDRLFPLKAKGECPKGARHVSLAESPIPALQRIFRLDFGPSADAHEIARALHALPIVERASPSYIYERDTHDLDIPPPPIPPIPPPPFCYLVANDPYFCSSGSWGNAYPDQWWIHRIDAQRAWQLHRGSADIVVAVLEDNGVDVSHPELHGRIFTNVAEAAGRDGVDDDGNGFVDDVHGYGFESGEVQGEFDSPRSWPLPGWGSHGTSVAGVVASVPDNGLGIAGVLPDVRILPIRMSTIDREVARAVYYAVRMGADVINTSFHSLAKDDVAMMAALQFAYGSGVAWVSSAGNTGGEAAGYYPAEWPETFAVGGLDPSGRQSQTFGPMLDVVAPSDDILTLRYPHDGLPIGGAVVDEHLRRSTGTSFSTPMVGAALGMLFSWDRELGGCAPGDPGCDPLTLEEARQILRRTAADVGAAGWDRYAAWGELRLGTAMLEAAAGARCEARILAPFDYTIVRADLPVRGIAAGRDYGSYELVVERGFGPGGVARVVGSSNARVPLGDLGEVAPRDVGSGRRGPARLHLRVYDTGGRVCGEDYRLLHFNDQREKAVVTGAAGRGHLGVSIAAGDLDGDGIDDLVMGTSAYSMRGIEKNGVGGFTAYATAGTDVAEVHVVFGDRLRAGGGLSLDESGLVVRAAGLTNARLAIADVDGDGVDDLAIGAPHWDRQTLGSGPNRGRVCVFLGGADLRERGSLALGAADYCFAGQEVGDYFGVSLASGGDLDGDGADDLVVGACGYDWFSRLDVGNVYVLYSSDLDLWPFPSGTGSENALGVAGTTIDARTTLPDCGGKQLFEEGLSASGIGDWNGDGWDDLAIGRWRDRGEESGAYLLFGGPGGVASGVLPASADVVIAGETDVYGYGYYVGRTASPAGDVDGDGFDDLLTAFSRTFANATYHGIAVVPGRPGVGGALNVPGDAWVVGELNEYALLGHAGAATDLDRDGLSDLVLSGPRYGRHWDGLGAAWVITGRHLPASAHVDELAAYVVRTGEYGWSAQSDEWFGTSLAIGDFDGDGYPQIAVGDSITVPENYGRIVVYDE